MKTHQTNLFIKQVSKTKDKQLKLSIFNIIQEVETCNTITELRNVKKLSGYKDYYRIRMGKYRIGIVYNEAENTITFASFAHRSKIYRIFP